jgi:outer membrane protein assembly factor BamA
MRVFSPAVLLLALGLTNLPASPMAAQVSDTATKPHSVSGTAPSGAAPGETRATDTAGADTVEARARGSRWRTSWFPYLTGGANDSPLLAFHVRYWQPADYEARTTYTGALAGGAGIAPHGSRFVALSFKAPGLWDGWRLNTGGALERQTRYGYFGLGNDTQYNKEAVGDANPYLYRVRRTQYRVGAEVTRRVKGPLQVSLLTEYVHAHFTALPGSSIFMADFPAGEVTEGDVSGRLAFVYDSRDNEYNTHQGLLLEAGTQVGSGGDGYTRQYAILRGYLQVREGTVLAARLAGAGMGGSPTLDSRFVLPGWERPVPVLGGEYSHRALDYGRLTGRGTLFGNFEIRHDLLAFGDLGAITLLAFLDAGRVFEQEPWKLTTQDMKVGGGGGVALRILRSTIFTFNFAGGPDGFNFSVGNGWMF